MRTKRKRGDSVLSPKTGRPVLPEGERKEYRLYIRMNEREHNRLCELADRLQLTKTQTVFKALELLERKAK